MTYIRVRVKTHWINGWFVRLFARPFVVIDDEEYRASFGKSLTVEVEGDGARVGAGIRYGSKGGLMGCEPEEIHARGGSSPERPIDVVLRNGFWNHTPFHVIRSRG